MTDAQYAELTLRLVRIETELTLMSSKMAAVVESTNKAAQTIITVMEAMAGQVPAEVETEKPKNRYGR